MTTDAIETRRLACGATLVVEPIPSVSSAALSWRVPVGSAGDAADGDGVAAVLSELIFRGAGGLDSRAHSDALDRLGVQRSAHVLTHHLRLAATLVGGRLEDALPPLAAMIVSPALPEETLPAVRSLCLQSIEALQDDPQHLVMLRLRERHHPPPFNRHGYGRPEVVERCTIVQLREAWAARARPEGSIIAAAGAVDAGVTARALDRLLERWRGRCEEPVETGAPPRGREHVDQETSQVHLGIAWDAPPESDPHSMTERVAVAVLSGGTSARLFTEVRQKRSLCYSVGASYRAGRDVGTVSLYAGTTPQRAAETLEVCKAEVRRLREGVTADEFGRAVTGLKSQLIMQGESTAARAAALGNDLFRLGRARTLDELAAAVDAVTLDGLNAYLRQRELGEFTVVSIGPPEAAGGVPGEGVPAAADQSG